MRKFLLAISGLLLGLCPVAASEPTDPLDRDSGCVYADDAAVKRLSERWAEAVAAGDVEAVTHLYAVDAIVMGLQEPSVRIGQIEIAQHFSRLLPGQLSFQTVSRTIVSQCGTATETGVYAVSIGLHQVTQSAPAIPVLYTVMYGFEVGAWKIIHHHMELAPGNVMPEVAPTPAPLLTRLSTGTTVPRADSVELPPPPFVLPQSAPVILSPTLRLVLSSARPIEPIATVTPAEPETAKHAAPKGGAPTAPVQGEPVARPKLLIETAVGAPAIVAPGASVAPAADFNPAALVALAAQTMAIAKLAEATAPRIIAVPAVPMVASTPSPLIQAQAAPRALAAVAAVAKRAPDAVQQQPALAGAKRASLPKPARLQGPAAPKAASAPVAGTSGIGGFKAGRWIDNVPTFDP